MINKSKLYAAVIGAVLLAAGGAHAVITGTQSEHQQQQFRVGQLQIGSATSTGNSSTANAGSGAITTASLTTAQGAVTAITLTNSRVAVGDMVQCTVDPMSSAGGPFCANAAVSNGQIIFNVGNFAAAALNNTVRIYWVINKTGNSN